MADLYFQLLLVSNLIFLVQKLVVLLDQSLGPPPLPFWQVAQTHGVNLDDYSYT